MGAIRALVVLLILVGFFITTCSANMWRFTAQAYAHWNQVPTEIHLGVLDITTASSNQTRRVELVNGTCIKYDVRGFTRCKFYGDCCMTTPTRVMEQLVKGSFSCHNGFYIVDKCPESTEDEELKLLCDSNHSFYSGK